MKYLLTIILLGWAFSLAAAVTPDFKVQKATFAAQDELQVKTQLAIEVAPGPAAKNSSRHIASEKKIDPSLQERQQQLIDREIKYWKYQND